MYIFDILTNPFIAVLVFLYQLLAQNFVLAIIVFTILVQLVTYPLTRAQLQSTKKMQELQPRLKKLQEKYKGDREKLAQAQMELYRQYGVNPAAGCLPLIIQMPVLIGLYSAISHTLASTPLQVLDLHHRLIPSLATRFPLDNQFLWLNLGLPDTTPILPLLVVATTWLRTKLTTPTPTDPKDPMAATSRTMLVMMPLMIGLFSVNFASGLSIYWIASNVVGVVQYVLMGKVDLRTMSAKQQPAVVSPVIEEDDEPVKVSKAAKSSGAGGSSSAKRPQTVGASAGSRGSSTSAAKNRPRMTPKKRK
jgi:YidC/Oxa1 family membrane protein insertase